MYYVKTHILFLNPYQAFAISHRPKKNNSGSNLKKKNNISCIFDLKIT